MILNTMARSYWFIVGLSVFISACGMQGGGEVRAGFEGLKAPQTEYSELSYPGPSFGKTTEGKVTISADHGFVLLKDDKVIQGVVNVSGQVESADAKQVVLQTEGGIVTLLYAIPGGTKLSVKPGGKMSVCLQPGKLRHATEYTITDSLDGRLLHASAKQSSDKPVHTKLSDDVEVYQLLKGTQPEIAGQTSVSTIPVMLSVKGKTTMVSGTDKTEVEINGAKYMVMVLNSIESRPAPGYEPESEGQGYWLEYSMVKQ